jgi:hypothetical protein
VTWDLDPARWRKDTAKVSDQSTDKPSGSSEGKPIEGPEVVPTATVTFLFTDIQGSTAMWERDAREPVEEKEISAPDTVDGWVAWHRESPYLEVSDTQPASIGGATGVRFDLTATSAPKEATDLCGDPYVPGYPVGPTAVDFYLGTEEQDHVLEVGDEIVLVSVTAPTGELEGFLPKAQAVLDTVEWQGAF